MRTVAAAVGLASIAAATGVLVFSTDTGTSADTTPPTAPKGLKVLEVLGNKVIPGAIENHVSPSSVPGVATQIRGRGSIDLTWKKAKDDLQVRGYRLWLDRVEVGTRSGVTLGTGIYWMTKQCQSHRIGLAARDGWGNTGPVTILNLVPCVI